LCGRGEPIPAKAYEMLTARLAISRNVDNFSGSGISGSRIALFVSTSETANLRQVLLTFFRHFHSILYSRSDTLFFRREARQFQWCKI
jgi:hypothetical protein